MDNGNENGGRTGWVVAGAVVRTMAGETVTILKVLPAPSMVRVQFADGSLLTVSHHDLREIR